MAEIEAETDRRLKKEKKMHTVQLDGTEYILRCDLNVIEKIEEKYETVAHMIDSANSLVATKFMIAEMINEHFYYAGTPERVTEDFVGARLTMAEMETAVTAALACLTDCVCKKK